MRILAERGRVRSGVAAYGCAGAVVAGVALAVAAAHHADETRRSPVVAAGDWRTVWSAALIGAFVAYVLGALLVKRRPVGLGLAVAVAVAVQTIPLAAPLLLSRDVYAYWDTGRIVAVHHANPYAAVPSDFSHDPVYPQVGGNWVDRVTVYGPVYTGAEAAVAAAVGTSEQAATLAFRALAAAAMIAMTLAAAAAVPARRRAFAAAFVGWSPLLALHFAGAAHNDSVAVMLAVVGVTLLRRRRPQLGGAALALGVLVKWTPAAVVPLIAADRLRRRVPLGAAGFVGAVLAVAAASTAVWGVHWITALTALRGQAQTAGSLGLASWLARTGMPVLTASRLLLAAFVVAYAWLLLEAWRGRPRLGLAMGLLVVSTAWLMPWYAVWAVPFAATEDDPPAQWLALALSGYLLHDAIPL